MSKREIYLDHASTTYLNEEVLKAMLPYFSEKYGNAESPHIKGKEALIAIDDAKETVAKYLNCKSSELTFTGSATEANNLAIFGLAKAAQKTSHQPLHIITSAIEHSSILAPLEELQKQGFQITYLPVDDQGLINPADLEKAIRTNTILVSIIYANNEIGTIQPISELGAICKKHQIPFHSDSCQAACALPLDTQILNVDLMTLNGSKIYGPKGIGLLYHRQTLKLEPLIYGGQQQKGLRSGTQDTPSIVGFTKALELAQENCEREKERLKKLKNQLIDGLLQKIPNTYLNGHPQNRLANNINVTFQGIDAKQLILHLDTLGVYVSSGSACGGKKDQPSHVLQAIGLSESNLNSTIRISLGKKNSQADIDYLLEILPPLIEKLRAQN